MHCLFLRSLSTGWPRRAAIRSVPFLRAYALVLLVDSKSGMALQSLDYDSASLSQQVRLPGAQDQIAGRAGLRDPERSLRAANIARRANATHAEGGVIPQLKLGRVICRVRTLGLPEQSLPPTSQRGGCALKNTTGLNTGAAHVFGPELQSTDPCTGMPSVVVPEWRVPALA